MRNYIVTAAPKFTGHWPSGFTLRYEVQVLAKNKPDAIKVAEPMVRAWDRDQGPLTYTVAKGP